MKIKRSIGILLCCLTVVGTFSVNGLSAEAVACTHPAFLLGMPDGAKEPYNDVNGHYEIRGTRYDCAKCGYSYWDGLYTVKTGEHLYAPTGATDANGFPVYSDYCAICGRERGK